MTPREKKNREPFLVRLNKELQKMNLEAKSLTGRILIKKDEVGRKGAFKEIKKGIKKIFKRKVK